MQEYLITAIGVILCLMVIEGMIRGKVRAGSRGFKTNFYSREDNPVLYFVFMIVYAVVSFFTLSNSL